MAEKKLSTQEILAQLRAKKASQPQDDSTAAEPPASGDAAVDSADSTRPEPKPAPSKPQSTPASTQDILAAARAQAAGDTAAAKPASVKPAASKPRSTQDILAAARAQAGDAAAPDAAASQPAAASPPAEIPTSELPSLQDMMRAVRGEPEVAAASTSESQAAVAKPQAKPKPVLPPTPVKPPARKSTKRPETRRNVLISLLVSPFALAWIFLSAATAASTLALARFMMPNVLVEPPTKFKIGPPSEYPEGTVSTKWKAARGVWIINTDQYDGQSNIVALASVCTHLGCTPNWLESEQKFKCPCHGSGFRITGINFEGPAPRPLERVGIRLAEDGMLEVDKSVKFQEELGQWEIPASYYPLA
ncbi:MAG: Rieske 2Fe-2S domain-containing protein [Planctomycetaceae bacterium]